MNWRSSELLNPIVEIKRLGLVTDMDGTISPIVNDPESAQITPRSQRLLKALHSCLTLVAVVSGRAADDVRNRVDIPDLIYVGNHGLEHWDGSRVIPAPEASQFRPNITAALNKLNQALIPGIQVEDKGATLSIHYRQAGDPLMAGQNLGPVVEEIARQEGLRFFQGRMVFELRPPVDIDKGTTFRQLIETHHLDGAFYIGDDTTDVDALQVARDLREQNRCYTVGVGVESSDMPASVRETADVMASGISDVESLLEWLLNARKASSTC